MPANRPATTELTLSPETKRMLRLLAVDAVAHAGGRPNISDVVSRLIEQRWREVGGPPPPLVPEAPPSMVLRDATA